jgi:hypothetical protein
MNAREVGCFSSGIGIRVGSDYSSGKERGRAIVFAIHRASPLFERIFISFSTGWSARRNRERGT